MVACKSNLKNVGTALEMYKADHKVYPEQLAQLAPKYLKVIPVCPGAKADTYSGSYTRNAEGLAYTVLCQGRHHQSGRIRQDNYPQYTSGNGLVTPSP